jgi:high-affinity nickel permease
MFMDYRVALVVLGLGFALNTHYVSVSMRHAGQVDENKLGYVVVIAQFVAIFVVSFLVYKIFGEDTATALSSMSSLGL